MNGKSCHISSTLRLSRIRRANQKGGERIALSPFQKALIQVVLDRGQREAAPEKDPGPENASQLCLWIDWNGRTISKNRMEDAVAVPCVSKAQRERIVKSLTQKQFRIVP